MKIKHQHFNARSRWLRKPCASGKFCTWLIQTSSLTARLQQKYSNFSVQTLRLSDAKPLKDEAYCLRSPLQQLALVREVLLKGNQQAVVFAHSVLPHRSLRGDWHGLGKLGNRPLGETLFANPKVKRTPISYKKLTTNHLLYQQAMFHSQQKPNYLWARRSIFSLNSANIMVTEVFLPALIEKFK